MDPRLIVEVRYGKLAGTKVAVGKGNALRVGRTELSDLVIGHDGDMSGSHFELSWDGNSCRLRDLGSVTGTRLGGAAMTDGVVPHGGWIQAGTTDFMVFIEGRTPPPLRRKPTDDETIAENSRMEAARIALGVLREKATETPLYAVVDGARDRRIVQLARQHVETHRSLYDGAEGENFEDMAPFLIGPMQKDSALLDYLVLEGWGKRWGIFVTSEEKAVEVRRHFRRFLFVELERNHEKVYFRFYDPGVFRPFWKTCSDAQKRELSEKLSEIYLEQKDLSLSALMANDRNARRA